MKIIIENADSNDFNELAKLARQGKIHTFCLTDEDEKRGKWIQKCGINYYFCNFCGSGNNNGGGIKTNFCPNCGARMENGGNG